MDIDRIEALRGALERRHIARLRAVLTRQGRAIADRLREGRGDPFDAVDAQEMADAIADLYGDAIPVFAAQVYEEVTEMASKRSRWLEVARAYVARVGLTFIDDIIATTRAIALAVIEEGVAAGMSSRDVADALMEDWPEVSALRAERIARTEIARAGNYATIEGARTASDEHGLQLEKEWLAAGDHRTRDSHRNVAKVPLDGKFNVGGYLADFPGDPDLPAEESINCRCAMAFVPAGRKTWIEQRNARIRQEYPALKGQYGQIQAIAELSDREALSERQVRRVLYGA
jgi:hypothetical protein